MPLEEERASTTTTMDNGPLLGTGAFMMLKDANWYI